MRDAIRESFRKNLLAVLLKTLCILLTYNSSSISDFSIFQKTFPISIILVRFYPLADLSLFLWSGKFERNEHVQFQIYFICFLYWIIPLSVVLSTDGGFRFQGPKAAIQKDFLEFFSKLVELSIYSKLGLLLCFWGGFPPFSPSRSALPATIKRKITKKYFSEYRRHHYTVGWFSSKCSYLKWRLLASNLRFPFRWDLEDLEHN